MGVGQSCARNRAILICTTMEEIWKDIKGFEGIYQVSDLGRIRSLDRLKLNKHNSYTKVKGCIIKSFKKKGYPSVSLSIYNTKKTFSVHRLVADSFILNLENKREVNHINGIKTDNRVNNLEWVSSKENIKHAYKMGLMKNKFGEKHHGCKLTEDQVIKIKYDLKELSHSEIAKMFNVNPSRISSIRCGRTWSHL